MFLRVTGNEGASRQIPLNGVEASSALVERDDEGLFFRPYLATPLQGGNPFGIDMDAISASEPRQRISLVMHASIDRLVDCRFGLSAAGRYESCHGG